MAAAIETSLPEVRGPIETALARLQQAGFPIVELDWPHADLVVAVSATVMFAEAARVHLGAFEADPGRYGTDVLGRLQRGRSISAPAYLAAMTMKDHITGVFSALFDQTDVIAGPTTPIVAPRLTEAEEPWVAASLVRHTRLDDLTGLPAISLPVQAPGLPVGLHLTGLNDEALLDAAAAVEDALSRPETR
jgi:aspartyl-tRNA(Asn)/glutamyl-tRNA(Gln) amidotransferase subunit A